MSKRKRKSKEPILVEVQGMAPKGTFARKIQNENLQNPHTDKEWLIKGVSVGDRVWIRPLRKGKGQVLSIEERAEEHIDSKCSHFGICGGCQFQNMTLVRQREEKWKMVQSLMGDLTEVVVHPIVGPEEGFGYRNKMEFSFSNRRFYSEEEQKTRKEMDIELPKNGSHETVLGMHPRGWYSKVVPIEHCDLISTDMNEILQVVQSHGLHPAWNNRKFEGIFRHVILREGSPEIEQNGHILVSLVTSTAATKEHVNLVSENLSKLDCVRGVLWVVTDRLNEVALGDVREVLYGKDEIYIEMSQKSYVIPHDGFFQVNIKGAGMLVSVLQKDIQKIDHRQQLVDLYCGSGSLGIALGDDFDEVIGIELHQEAIEVAKKNALRNNVHGQWFSGKVEDVVLDSEKIHIEEHAILIVDPPRVGLHPKAAVFLSTQKGAVLYYIACNPKSLARDKDFLESGHWKMTDLWTIDLFPQTPHVESIAKFVRK
jgi:23S rRNA (uracil1939-C5)-methyltransferase